MKLAAIRQGDKATIDQIGSGKDILSILRKINYQSLECVIPNSVTVPVRANLEASGEDKLPEDEIIGQIRYAFSMCVTYKLSTSPNFTSTFVFAGADTTTGALCRTLHLLALNPSVQDKLRREVTAAREDRGDLDYDDLMRLPFLDAVCRETLRVYPPVSTVVRT